MNRNVPDSHRVFIVLTSSICAAPSGLRVCAEKQEASQMLGQRLRRCLVVAGTMTNHSKHLYNICTMLGQRRRRWANIV